MYNQCNICIKAMLSLLFHSLFAGIEESSKTGNILYTIKTRLSMVIETVGKMIINNYNK